MTALILLVGGCQSIRNGWLDPTAIGRFEGTATLEIRESLTLEDTPRGVPGAAYPWPEDLRMIVEEYPIAPGDQLAIEIYELRERQIPYLAQVQVSATGEINMPVIGRVKASDYSVAEFEDALADTLRDRQVLLDPQVTVNPIFMQKATYSLFGIGVSAADNAPLRAGTFPIRRPDLRLLEAINLVGGLNEFVTEVYIFRTYVPPERRKSGEYSAVPGSSALDAMGRSVPATPSRESDVDALPSTSDAPADQPMAYRDDAIRNVLDVVEAPGPAGQSDDVNQEGGLVRSTGQPAESDRKQQGPIDRLVPDPTLPYVWVNGAFVRNPAYVAPQDQQEIGIEPEPLRFDNPSPTVNWARLAGDTAYRIIGVPADSLRNGDPEADIYVRPGDVIRVVSGEIGVYYVMGQVNRVGAFSFNAEPITLKAAIAGAGGLSPLAWPDRCTVYRRVGQREQMIQVDLDRIFAGKDPDFMIRRGDIVNVGTHPFAPFLQRIRGFTLPNPVSNVGYSFTYARNFADIDSFSVQQNPANQPSLFQNLFP